MTAREDLTLLRYAEGARAGASGQSGQSGQQEFAKVAVLGLGYIGLPTAAIIASGGAEVLGVDVKEHVLRGISSGSIHIYEPDLDGLVQKVVTNGSLRVAAEPKPSNVFIIAVPTPIDDHKRPVLTSVFSAARSIAPVLERGNLVIIESTSPVGTTEAVCALLSDLRPDLTFPRQASAAADVNVAYCPERVLPGRILSEIVQNDRCIGGVSKACSLRAQQFYKSFVRGACIMTTARTAELVKLTENAFRDVNIAFANELSMICDRLDISVWDVINLANRHPRVTILRPGPGVGGHCISVDPWFIVHSTPDLANLVRTARTTNDGMVSYTIAAATALIEAHPCADVACLGLSFKANVDDLRGSPASQVAKALAESYGRRIKIIEPYIRELPSEIARTGAGFVSLKDALASCGVAIVLVDHEEFRSVPLGDRRHLAVLDTRGIWGDLKELI
jgi:UDP-N-acetyl-D-mannosaminuronic acid dehydrogenase